MRKSSSVTVTLLAGLMLTSCCVGMNGCGRAPLRDRNWYDQAGNRIEEKWKADAAGNKLLDDKGRPIPDPHVPYDRYHRPWVYSGAWVPLPPPAGSRSYSRSGSSWWGGSGYRGFSSGGSSSPSHSPGSSISRGGFGSTGHGSGGS
jgi:hypothetical protein